jgi:hypothetical protein
MTEMPRSYTERRNLIAQKLEPYFHISNLLPTNLAPAFEPAPGLRPNSLMCSWGDPATGENKLFVYISQVADGERNAISIREMMMNEAPPDPGQPPEEAEAYEIPGQRQGEYVFVLNYLGRLTALVGDCWVDIAPMPVSFPLSDIAEVALDIGRISRMFVLRQRFPTTGPSNTARSAGVDHGRRPDLRPENTAAAVSANRRTQCGVGCASWWYASRCMSSRCMPLVSSTQRHTKNPESTAHRA